MSKALIERLREAAAQRVASTAMIGAADLSVAADVLEQTEAARMAAISRLCEAEVACATACQERDALAAELKALRARAIELEAETKSSEEMQTLKFCEREWSTERAAMMNTIHALRNCGDAHPVPARELTDEEILNALDGKVGTQFLTTPVTCKEFWLTAGSVDVREFVRAIERYLKGVSENG